jgi:hypothetical protein
MEFDNAAALAAYGDGTYRVRARTMGGVYTEMDVPYTMPGSSAPIPQPTQKPRISSPGYDEGVDSPVDVRWDTCTDGAVNTITLSIANDATGMEVAGDVFGKTVTSAGAYALAEAVYMAQLGFVGPYDAASTDETQFEHGKLLLLGHRFEGTQSSLVLSDIYRFWSRTVGNHFYTLDEDERDKLIDQFPHVWAYEGPVFQASASQSVSALVPVYRFWSATSTSHFYTLDEAERDKLINDYPHVWAYEGTAFYAYPDGDEPAGANPVYRFWNQNLGTHFYTMDEAERDKLLNEYPHIFIFEGTAFHAYP